MVGNFSTNNILKMRNFTFPQTTTNFFNVPPKLQKFVMWGSDLSANFNFFFFFFFFDKYIYQPISITPYYYDFLLSWTASTQNVRSTPIEFLKIQLSLVFKK
jgi:hypothetical protein